MPQRPDPTPARPTAAWISRYATDLLSTRPTLQPLDAVRLAMDAAAGREQPAPRGAAGATRR
jgi:hypothetical protein